MNRNKNKIKLACIEWFSARGLWKVYAVDHYQFRGKRKYSMDIWATKDGRLLTRFYSRCSEAENVAYEIRGMTYADIPEDEISDETWIPDFILKEFENWMISEMPSFTSMKEFFNCK